MKNKKVILLLSSMLLASMVFLAIPSAYGILRFQEKVIWDSSVSPTLQIGLGTEIYDYSTLQYGKINHKLMGSVVGAPWMIKSTMMPTAAISLDLNLGVGGEVLGELIGGLIYDKMNLIDTLHSQGQVIKREYRSDGVYIEAEVPILLAKKIDNILLDSE